MARSITYIFEDENGDEREYEVSYSVTPGSSGTWEQPPDEAEINILSITEGGIEVNAVNDYLLDRISNAIWNEVENDEYDYDEDE